MSNSRLAQRIAASQPKPGSVAAWWLGGSGFIFKTPSGQQVWVDPYLSDIVRPMFGVGRAFPPPITPEEAMPDVIVSSHFHEDHLDPGCIPEIARRRPNATFVMSPGSASHALAWGLTNAQIKKMSWDQTFEIGGVKITAIVARHEAGVPGWEVPDAMGVVLDFGGVKIYHTGDTDYDSRIHRALKGTALAFATLCMNGSVGNMNAHEAALLSRHLDVKTLIPHHHYLWDRTPAQIPWYETLDPNLFADTYRRLGGTGNVVIPEVARGMTITADGLTVDAA